MTLVGSRTATEMKLSADGAGLLPTREVIDHLLAVNFVLELSTEMALASTTEIRADRQAIMSVVPIEQMLRARRIRYGSPLQLVIDLPALLDFLESTGLILFLALAGKAFATSSEGWKNIEEAAKLRGDRKRSRHVANPTGGEVSVVRRNGDEPRLAQAAVLIEPLIRALQEEAAAKSLQIDSGGARVAGRRYIELHEEESETAGRVLKKTTIKIEFE